MTYKEAIDYIENEIKIDVALCNDNDIENHIECFKIACEALEKQIPKKPLPEEKIYGNGICPSCGAYFLDKSTKYCGNCGQALDWGKT